MKFYVFSEGFGVMAHSEALARETVRQEWAKDHIGDPEEAAQSEIIQVFKANQLVSFFC